MRISKYDLLAEYMYRERYRLESEVKQLQDTLRYRRISSVDCLELIIAQERLSSFLEFSGNVRAILRMKEEVFDEDPEDKS